MVEATAIHGASAAPRKPWYTVLYIQVLIAIALGVAVGHFYPQTGNALKPLGDAFINLIKMMIAPVIFCTVVHGISSMGDLKKIGRVGIKTLFYFEIVSTVRQCAKMTNNYENFLAASLSRRGVGKLWESSSTRPYFGPWGRLTRQNAPAPF
jgi:hypothetical protein